MNEPTTIPETALIQAPTLIEQVEALTASLRFKQVMRSFKASKPFVGSFSERLGKILMLNQGLSSITGKDVIVNIAMPAMLPEQADQLGARGMSMSIVQKAIINGQQKYILILMQKLSVITFLTGWGMILGLELPLAKAWSKSTFALFFPEEARKLKIVNDGKGNEVIVR